MSKTKRKRYSAEFKAKVALDAIRGEQTLSELATRYDLHPNMITTWKRQAIENMAETFSSKVERASAANEAQIKDLHAKIGQLTVERDFTLPLKSSIGIETLSLKTCSSRRFSSYC